MSQDKQHSSPRPTGTDSGETPDQPDTPVQSHGPDALIDASSFSPPDLIFSASPASDPSEMIVSEIRMTGPIPPPDLLRQYGEIDQSFPERLVSQFESESKHRRLEERRASATAARDMVLDRTERRIGQFIACLISFAMLGATVWVTLAGHPVVGGGIAGSLAIVIATFVTGQYIRVRREPESGKQDDSA